MRILELCLSPDLGGLELYAYRTATALRRKSIDVDLLLSPDSKLANLATTDCVPYRLFKRRGKVFPFIAAVKLARYMDENKIDLIHVHWAKDIALAVLTKKFSRRPIRIVYTRQMEILGPKKDIYHDFIYKNIDLLLTITDRLRNQAIHFTNIEPEHVVRLYYGVDPIETHNPEFCKIFKIENNIDQKAFVVGLVGRIEEFKGQHILVEALEQLTSEGLNVHGIILGNAMDDNYLSELKKRVSSGITKGRITFLSFQPNPGKIMSCFDTLVLTTRLETFGLVLIEAMQAGLPVIGTKAGGVPEIIEDNHTGLMFPPDDANTLAKKIRSYINNPNLRKQCAENGQNKARESFSSERHYSQLVNHFQMMLP